jgi:hypothetical protein
MVDLSDIKGVSGTSEFSYQLGNVPTILTTPVHLGEIMAHLTKICM